MANSGGRSLTQLPAQRHERQKLGTQPAWLAEVITLARRYLRAQRVILFGSRARGDARADSDYDLAIDHDAGDAAWADFAMLLRETAPTLDDLDLVDLRRASPDLRRRIEVEGIRLDG